MSGPGDSGTVLVTCRTHVLFKNVHTQPRTATLPNLGVHKRPPCCSWCAPRPAVRGESQRTLLLEPSVWPSRPPCHTLRVGRRALRKRHVFGDMKCPPQSPALFQPVSPRSRPAETTHVHGSSDPRGGRRCSPRLPGSRGHGATWSRTGVPARSPACAPLACGPAVRWRDCSPPPTPGPGCPALPAAPLRAGARPQGWVPVSAEGAARGPGAPRALRAASAASGERRHQRGAAQAPVPAGDPVPLSPRRPRAARGGSARAIRARGERAPPRAAPGGCAERERDAELGRSTFQPVSTGAPRPAARGSAAPPAAWRVLPGFARPRGAHSAARFGLAVAGGSLFTAGSSRRAGTLRSARQGREGEKLCLSGKRGARWARSRGALGVHLPCPLSGHCEEGVGARDGPVGRSLRAPAGRRSVCRAPGVYPRRCVQRLPSLRDARTAKLSVSPAPAAGTLCPAGGGGHRGAWGVRSKVALSPSRAGRLEKRVCS